MLTLRRMKLPRSRHSWCLTPRQAADLQTKLAREVVVAPPEREIRLVAGLDAAFTADGRKVLAAVVLWDVPGRRVVEQHTAEVPLRFPYVPGLLSFREAPALLAVLKKLDQAPDVLMCDGQGLAHPRRFGLACHLGLLCGMPSLGVAKSLLVGEHGSLGPERGASAELIHRGEVVGVALRTRPEVKPIFVSVGHLIDLSAATRLVLECCVKWRIPEPTRLADRLVAQVKRMMKDEG